MQVRLLHSKELHIDLETGEPVTSVSDKLISMLPDSLMKFVGKKPSKELRRGNTMLPSMTQPNLLEESKEEHFYQFDRKGSFEGKDKEEETCRTKQEQTSNGRFSKGIR